MSLNIFYLRALKQFIRLLVRNRDNKYNLFFIVRMAIVHLQFSLLLQTHISLINLAFFQNSSHSSLYQHTAQHNSESNFQNAIICPGNTDLMLVH